MPKLSTLRALVALCVLLTVLGVDFAYASLKGASTNSSTVIVSSGTWSEVVVATPSTANTFSAYSFTTKGGTVGNFMSLRNFGTLNNVTVTITLTVKTTGTKTNQLQVCSTTWNESTGACSSGGTITTIMSTTSFTSPQTVTSYPMAIAIGGSVRLRVLDNQSGYTDTISVSLARVDTRAATTTNS